jgi:hypothetical protein
VNTAERPAGFRSFRSPANFICPDQIFSGELRSTEEIFAPGNITFKAVVEALSPEPDSTKLETLMNIKYLSAALMAAGLLITAPAFAQASRAQKQQTTEGGGSTYGEPCSPAENANPKADPDCKQRAQNLTPSPLQANQEATGQK